MLNIVKKVKFDFLCWKIMSLTNQNCVVWRWASVMHSTHLCRRLLKIRLCCGSSVLDIFQSLSEDDEKNCNKIYTLYLTLKSGPVQCSHFIMTPIQQNSVNSFKKKVVKFHNFGPDLHPPKSCETSIVFFYQKTIMCKIRKILL